MKLPRDVSGSELAKKLEKLGYHVTRQSGSHMRLTRNAEEKEHHITIPNHSPLKIGTLHSILKNIADELRISREKLIDHLWGND